VCAVCVRVEEDTYPILYRNIAGTMITRPPILK